MENSLIDEEHKLSSYLILIFINLLNKQKKCVHNKSKCNTKYQFISTAKFYREWRTKKKKKIFRSDFFPQKVVFSG